MRPRQRKVRCTKQAEELPEVSLFALQESFGARPACSRHNKFSYFHNYCGAQDACW